MTEQTEMPIRKRLVDMSIGQVEQFKKDRYEYVTSMVYRLQTSLTRKYSVRNRKDEPMLYVERIS